MPVLHLGSHRVAPKRADRMRRKAQEEAPMTIQLAAFNNCDDVYLAWTSGQPIANCLAYAIL